MKFTHFAPIRFREARADSVNERDRTAQVILLTEGMGNLRDRNYYTSAAVESAVEVFDGKQFYIDHPTKQEDEIRPERSVRDLAGYFSDTELGTVLDPETGKLVAACFGVLHFAESHAGDLALQQVKTALQYQEQFGPGKGVYCGISINAGGATQPGNLPGIGEVEMVQSIEEAFSADIVTKPARGGKFVAVLAEAKQKRPYSLLTEDTYDAKGEPIGTVRSREKEDVPGGDPHGGGEQESEKWPKELVNYRYSDDSPTSGMARKECGNCRFFQAPGGCSQVDGTIRKVDVCNLFEMRSNPTIPTAPRGAQESIRTFESAYRGDSPARRAFEESYGEATLLKSRNMANKNFSINETVQRLRSAGWTLADHDTNTSVFWHRKLKGHSLAVRGNRFEHRDAEGERVARGPVSGLAAYAEAAPGLLGKLSESVKAFSRSYD